MVIIYIYIFEEYNLITFPVKHNWWEKADLNLIEDSSTQLRQLFEEGYNLGADLPKIYMPKPGCGNGQLDWDKVQEYISNINHLIIIVDRV